jgi:hypothetical protein
MHRMTSGGKFAFMKLPHGRLSAQSKFKKPNVSNCLRVESMAVGVDIKRMITMVTMCRKSLLKRNMPLLEPPMFFHKMSMGSLARFMSRI